MRREILKIRKLAVAILAAVMFVSCSESSELLNLVPKDSKLVLYAKPLDLAKKADLQNLQLKNDTKEGVKQVKDFFTGDLGIDPENFVAFESGKEMWLLFNVKDEEKLKSSITVKETKSIDGFTVLEGRGAQKFIIKDGICFMVSTWGMASEEAVKCAKVFMDLSDDNSINAVPGFEKNMSGSDANVYLNMAGLYENEMDDLLQNGMAGISLESMPNYEILKNSVAYMSASFERNDLTISYKLLDNEGNNVMSKLGLKDLDKGMLKFFDKDASAVLAGNIPAGYVGFISTLVMANISDNPVVSAAVSTVLNSLDGNIAIGAKVDNLRDAYGNDYTAVVKLKPGADKDIKSLIDNNLSMMGVAADAQGVYTIPVKYDFNVRIGFKDDYMYVTNASSLPDNGYDSSDNAKKFSGKTGAFLLDIPQGSVLAGAATAFTGSNVSGYVYAWSDDEKAEYVVHVNDNTEKNILTYFIKIVDKI